MLLRLQKEKFMKKLFITIILLALFTSSVSAQSQNKEKFSVQALLNDCEADKPIDQVYCLGFINGIMSGFGVKLQDQNGDIINRRLYCPDNRVSLGQGRQIFINWAERNPDLWSDEAWRGVLLALSETYPCENL
jgi:hypothetical protein